MPERALNHQLGAHENLDGFSETYLLIYDIIK
jgi:hypothetical protein